jgi:hypothetical protein
MAPPHRRVGGCARLGRAPVDSRLIVKPDAARLPIQADEAEPPQSDLARAGHYFAQNKEGMTVTEFRKMAREAARGVMGTHYLNEFRMRH